MPTEYYHIVRKETIPQFLGYKTKSKEEPIGFAPYAAGSLSALIKQMELPDFVAGILRQSEIKQDSKITFELSYHVDYKLIDEKKLYEES